jgi:hypothetical protein
MAHRRFTDREGRAWEIRVRNRNEWEFEPVGDNPGPARLVAPPGYEHDPFEMSVEELQKLVDAGRARRPPGKSPFLD